MKRRLVGLMFLAIVGVGVVLTGCAPLPAPVPPEIVDLADQQLEWYPVNPPRPGLQCWIAAVAEFPTVYKGLGYGFVYCEPAGPRRRRLR